MIATTEEMMEFLWQRRVKALPPEGLAEVFDRLIWCMDDQGVELLKVRAKWLAGDDIEKARVALVMNEAFPGNTRGDLVALCDRLSSRWAELRPECERLLLAWDKCHEPKT